MNVAENDGKNRQTVAELLSVDLSVARADAEYLLAHALQTTRAWLYTHATDAVDEAMAQRYRGLLARRQAGEPVAYLTGAQGFWTLQLQVTPATLIPRPETELLVELALARLAPAAAARIADLGTGSGAIALAIARERPQCRVVATDASAQALDVARGNALRNAIGNVEFRLGDWFAPLQGELFDLIASNPPYIAGQDPHLGEGDLRFEPPAALVSGADGLEAIRTIVDGAAAHLHPGGWLLLEHGLDQGAAVRGVLQAAGFHQVATERDLEARERVSLGRRD